MRETSAWERGPLLALLALAVLAAGCLGVGGGDESLGTAEDTPSEEPDDANETSDTVTGEHRVPLVRVEAGEVSFEADVACALGGGPRLPREASTVPNGTDRIEVHVETPPTYTHIQIGHLFAEDAPEYADREASERITWLDPVAPGEAANRTVPVTEDTWEPANEGSWAFYLRLAPPSPVDPCYTGAGVGAKVVHVDAVVDPSPTAEPAG
jgi:hypothetical protein